MPGSRGTSRSCRTSGSGGAKGAPRTWRISRRAWPSRAGSRRRRSVPGSDFQYALLRVVPRLERGEQINAGVVLFARRAGFLEARVRLDVGRLAALAPDADPLPLTRQLEAIARVAAGDPDAGPVAALPQS